MKHRGGPTGLFGPILTDVFAGLGGASLGMEMATGRIVHVCVNHWDVAIQWHGINHPHTRHIRSDVWDVCPDEATDGRDVGCAWFSPDCRHFSRARGAAPVSKRVRSLAWVVCKWAKVKRPPVLMVENVREFQEWGPTRIKRHRNGRPVCDARGRALLEPDPNRKGETFRRWVRMLERLGYCVEWRVLNAADYGVPQHRRRLFVLARCDRRAIVWPEVTHGPVGKDPGRGAKYKTVSGGPGAVGVRDGRAAESDVRRDKIGSWVSRHAGGRGGATAGMLAYRTAAECIDWSIPCPSIFERKKPLAENSLRRVAMGVVRFVLESPRPYIVNLNHGGQGFRGQGVGEPIRTVSGAHGQALVTANVVKFRGKSSGSDVAAPLPTITSGAGAARPAGAPHALGVQAMHLMTVGYGERAGQAPRVGPVDVPAGTVVGGGCKSGLVAASIVRIGQTGSKGGHVRGVDAPLTAVVGEREHCLTAASMIRMNFGDKQWHGVDEPLRTITSQGNKAGLVFASLVKYYGQGVGQAVTEPAHTVTGKDRLGRVDVEAVGTMNAVRDASTLARAMEVAAMVLRFVPAARKHAADVIVGGVRVGQVLMVKARRAWHVLADIGLRMLEPRELARCQGFPDWYRLPAVKSKAVKLIGNSVPPQVVAALVAANLPELCERRKGRAA